MNVKIVTLQIFCVNESELETSHAHDYTRNHEKDPVVHDPSNIDPLDQRTITISALWTSIGRQVNSCEFQ